MRYYLSGSILIALFMLAVFSILSCKPGEADPVEMDFNLTWTAPDPNDGDAVGATCDSYDLRYSAAPIDAANWNDATPVSSNQVPTPNVPGHQEAATVTILWESSRTIYFAIKSYDNAGNVSSLSNVYQTLSPDIVGPETITDLGG